MQDRKQLIYVYGLGRSGTTLLGQVLGQGLDTNCVGEFVRFAATDDLTRKKHPNSKDVRELPCGCGRIGSDCEQNALTKYLSRFNLFSVERFFSLSSLVFPLKDVAEPFFKSVKEIYYTYAEHTIVDTSKNARILFFMRSSSTFKDIDIHGIFIYRNIRDVWKSWRSDKDYLKKKSHPIIFKNILGGLFWCVVVYLINRKRDVLIRFNDFKSSPESVIQEINNKFGLGIEISERTVTIIRQNHEVAGNPSKLDNTNSIVIK